MGKGRRFNQSVEINTMIKKKKSSEWELVILHSVVPEGLSKK